MEPGAAPFDFDGVPFMRFEATCKASFFSTNCPNPKLENVSSVAEADFADTPETSSLGLEGDTIVSSIADLQNQIND